MAASTTFINDMLNTAFTGTITIGLFSTGLPSTTGVEASGGGYARQTITVGTAASKVISSAGDVTFSNLLTSQTYVAYGVYKAGVLIDENTLSSQFTADVSNNELKIVYSFRLNA